MRKYYDKELKEMHDLIVDMGNLCQEAIFMAARIIKEQNPELADEINGKEVAIDKKEREIEHACMHLILHQQPVATDLRRISAALKVISDMERIGDQASDIAELSDYISDYECQSQVHLWDMAQATVKMVTDSVAAFVNEDVPLAKTVMAADDQVDSLFEKVKDEIIELIVKQTIDAKSSLDLLMAAKYFERIGDHAVNVAEWAEYAVTGIREDN